MIRQLQPELLDSLPSHHPEAKANRRDLLVINWLTGDHRWIARTLPRRGRPGELLLELGAGTGELGRSLAARGLAVEGLDLCPRPPAWPADRPWHQTDLLTFEHYARYPIVVGNLIFHQFTAEQLAVLGATLRRSARIIVACEPARRRRSQVLLAALGVLIAANRVTRHDSRVSIAAGFLGDELPAALGLTADAWEISCRVTVLGTMRLFAVRRQ